MTGGLVFDGVLCLTLILLGGAALAMRDALDGAILFGTFGLVMALAWLRLGAPDLALVEATIELVVILFFGVLGYLRRAAVAAETRDPSVVRRGRLLALAGVVPLVLLFTGVVMADRLWEGATALKPLVDAHVAAGDVKNPVTAVLLNLRSLDTLLEISVLLLALVAVHSLEPLEPGGRPPPVAAVSCNPEWRRMPAMSWFAARAVPIGVLLAVYLWYAGSSQAGGAFQGGAMLGGMIGVVFMTRLAPQPRPLFIWARGLAAVGLVVFVLVALGLVALGRAPLEYPPGTAKTFILGIEGILTLSIGVTLGAIVVSVPGRARFV